MSDERDERNEVNSAQAPDGAGPLPEMIFPNADGLPSEEIPVETEGEPDLSDLLGSLEQDGSSYTPPPIVPPLGYDGGNYQVPPRRKLRREQKDRWYESEWFWKTLINLFVLLFVTVALFVPALLGDLLYQEDTTQFLLYGVAGLVEGVVLAYWFLIGWPSRQRKWADGEGSFIGRSPGVGQPIFWSRVPEMHAIFVLRDKRLHRVLVSSSGPRSRYFEDWVVRHQNDYPNVHYEIVEPGEELKWIGVPWRYSIKTWYEHSDDAHNADEDPRGVLTLSERTMDWDPKETTSTADPVEVKARLIASLLVVDPTRAVYSIQYYLEIIRKEIWAELRQVMTGLSYFSITESTERPPYTNSDASRGEIEASLKRLDLKVNPDLQQKLFRRLNKRLGFVGFDSDEEDGVFMPDQKAAAFGESWPMFQPGSILQRIRDTYGVVISQPVMVKDVDLADPVLKKAVDKIAQTRTEMVNAVMAAEKDRQEMLRRTDGETYNVRQIAEALKAKMEDLNLTDGTPLLLQEMLPQAMTKSNVTFLGVEGVAQLFGLLAQGRNLFPQAPSSPAPRETSRGDE